MSRTTRTSSIRSAPRDAGTTRDDSLPGSYLTDGTRLYRCVGVFASGMGQMIGLEDCRSLEVALVPIGEMHARRLRCVSPDPE